MCVDLHLHSIYSDGTATPAELTAMAARAGLSCISLTDHDTVEGSAEAAELGRQHGIEVISGLEISAVHGDISLHILGYGIDYTSDEFHHWLARLQHGRSERNERILGKMRQLGHDIDPHELQSISGHGQAGRPHIARLLMNRGIVSSFNEAFTLYLRKGGRAWAGRFAYTAAESIRMIHRAGGLAVMAHPGQLTPWVSSLSLLIAQLVECGLDGLEVHYPSHSAVLKKRLEVIAGKYNLVVTGGSDYHGLNRKYSVMAGGKNGFCPPDSILQPLESRLAARNITNQASM
jgi:3',5'-nucleoside bisphosphate phosphatase